MPNSKSRHIVITGASRGLGRALSENFIAQGHHVSACARDASTMAAMAEQFGQAHRFDVVDLSQPTQIAQWCEALLEDKGAPQLLINNAGVINRNAPLWEIDSDEFQQVIDINIAGVFNVTRGLLPAMIEQNEGVVVNLSSGWGRSVSPEVAPYCASKWAIEGMTKALAAELPGTMAAVPLNPGMINTDMLQSCFGAAADNHEQAEAWAKTAAPFLLGLKASDNGQSLSAP